MNNKLFLALLIGFVILLVIFIIILLTTEDSNNLIKSIGSSILILFGGSIIGYTTCSKNNKCKCGSYENCICGTNEIKGSGVLDWISEKFFGNKNNTQKEVEINNLNQMLKVTRNGLDSINNEYIFLKNENLNSIMQSNISIKQKYFDKINKIENNADTYNFQNILYLQLIFNSMAKNEQNLYKDNMDKHLNKLIQDDKKRLNENINMFENDKNIDSINPKNRKKIKNKEYLKLLDKAEKELQKYKDLELAKKTPLPDDKMLVRVTIPKKNKKIVINMINKLKNDIPMLEENDIPMLEENNLKNKIVDSISKYEVRTPTEWKNIKIILKHDSEIEQKITPDIINKIIDYISEFEENNPLPDNKENDILEEAKNTPLPDDEENLSYDIPISDNILNSQLTNEMIEISAECEKNLDILINLFNKNKNNLNKTLIDEINKFINDAPNIINSLKNKRHTRGNLSSINQYILDYITKVDTTNEMKENNINNQRIGFRPVSLKDFQNNAKKNKNQYIDNTLNNTLKKVQETKELIQVQENVQNIQETIESLINKNEQLNNDKMNIFNTQILPEFEKNLQTLNSLVKINENKLKNIDELNNYIEEIFQWKKNEIININNDNIDIMDYVIIRINNKILDKINEVNNILKENRIEQYKNELDLKDNIIEQTNIVQTEITDNLQKINEIEKEQQENKEKIKQTNNLNNLEKASNIVLSMNKNIESENLDKEIELIKQNIKELYHIITSYRKNIINNNNINKESYDLFKETMYKFDDLETVIKIKEKYRAIERSMNDIKNKITNINNKNYDEKLSKIEEYNNDITTMYGIILNLQELFNSIKMPNKEKIEQTNIVQTDNLQKINAIEKEKNKNNLQVANVLKNLKIQIENNTDLNDDNINEISESISKMITNIEKEQNENKAMAIEEKEMWEFIINREDEKFNTNWNLLDDDDDGVTPITEKAKYFWKPSSIKELPNNLNILDNNINNKIKENTTQIKENINNIITYNCNSITNLFNTINDKKIPVVDDAKLKMITEIYSKINSKDMNIKDCKFIEDNLTEINRLIDFYNKNKKEDKLNKISIKDGKINIDSPAKSPSSAAATTPASGFPASKAPTPGSSAPGFPGSKAPTPGSSAATSKVPIPTPSSSTSTSKAPTLTPASGSPTFSSSLGSSLPTNLSGLPIIAPALKYKESEKKDTSFDKYLAKLLSSSI